jgi:hypothetical protein
MPVTPNLQFNLLNKSKFTFKFFQKFSTKRPNILKKTKTLLTLKQHLLLPKSPFTKFFHVNEKLDKLKVWDKPYLFLERLRNPKAYLNLLNQFLISSTRFFFKNRKSLSLNKKSTVLTTWFSKRMDLNVTWYTKHNSLSYLKKVKKKFYKKHLKYRVIQKKIVTKSTMI